MKARFSDLDRTVQSDPVNREPLIILVLLALRICLDEKCMKPLESWSNRAVLRTVAGFRGSHSPIFLQYLAGKQIPVHKEFEYKKQIAREKRKTECQVGEVANITVNFLVVYLSDHPHLLFSSSPSRQHFARQAAAINSSPHIGSCFLFLSSVPTVLPDKTTTT